MPDPTVPDDLLKRIVFRLRWFKGNIQCFGTGFFISADGFALTAFHNLPDEAKGDAEHGGNGEIAIDADFGEDTQQFQLRWHLPSPADWEWQDKLDVAVLKGSEDEVSNAVLIKSYYLELSASVEQRQNHWNGRHVAVRGFSAHFGFCLPEPIEGCIWQGEPLKTVWISTAEGHPKKRLEDALAFGPVIAHEIKSVSGMSGAPVYDHKREMLAAVQLSAGTKPPSVYACEFRHIAEHWKRFRKEMAVALSLPEIEPQPPPSGNWVLGTIVSILIVAAIGAALWWTARLRIDPPPVPRALIPQPILVEPVAPARGSPNTSPVRSIDDFFLGNRPGSRDRQASIYLPEAAPIGESLLGITLWQLSPAKEADSNLLRFQDLLTGEFSYWSSHRLEPDSALPKEARVRITVESPNPGFLYVIDRELYSQGNSGKPYLIFPLTKTRGGNNSVRAGLLIDIPAFSDVPPFFTLRSNDPARKMEYAGELLSFLIAPKEIEGLTIGTQPLELPEQRVLNWEKRWGAEMRRYILKGGRAQAMLTAEHESTLKARILTQEDPAPQIIYSVRVKAGSPFVVSMPIRIARE